MKSRLVAALLAAAAAALPLPAVADAAAVKVSVKKGSKFESPFVTDPNDYYRSLTTNKPDVFCGKGSTLIGVGWGGSGGFLGSVAPNLGQGYSYASFGIRNSMIQGKFRGLAICAKGNVAAKVKQVTSDSVSCGSKLTLGIASPQGSPFQEPAAFFKPKGKGWTSNLGQDGTNDSFPLYAICVKKSAFKSVKTINAKGSFKVGSTTADVTATCKKGTKPISWGFEAAVMDGNIYKQTGITNRRTTAFVSSAWPKGSRGWKLTFTTPDGKPAATPAEVKAYVTCAAGR